MANEDRILLAYRRREHAREVREVWRNVAVSTVGKAGAITATRWADDVADVYDQKFRPTDEPE